MENKPTFVKQAAILAAAGLISRVIGFMYRLPLTELIGDEGNGIYAQGYYLYSLFLIISSAGLPAAISKMVSRRLALEQYRNAHEVFKVALITASLTGLTAALILGFGAEALAELIGWPRSYYSILTLSPTIFIVAIMAVFRGYFQGMNNTVPTAISQLIEQIFNAVFTVFLAYMFVGQGLEMGAAGGTAGTGIGAFVGLLIIFLIYHLAAPTIKRKVRFDRNRQMYERRGALAKELIATAVPIIVGTAVFSFTNIIDMVMTSSRLMASGAFSTKEAESLYGILAGKYATLTTLPVSISTAMATAVIPTIVASITLRDHPSVARKINMALRICMLISIPAAIGIGLLGDQILLLLFPRASAGGNLLRVGSISIIFLAMVQITTGILQAVGRLYIPVAAALIGSLVKIPLNYILIAIPEINVLGAVISSVACYAVAALIDLFFLKRITGVPLDLKGSLLKPLLASAVMGLCCYISYYVLYYALSSNTLALLFSILIGVSVYLWFMLLMHGFHKSDILILPYGKKIAAALERHGLL